MLLSLGGKTKKRTTQAIVGNTYDRITFVTPNGVTAKVIFQVVVP